MVNLKIGGRHLFQIDKAATSVFLDQSFLDDFREARAAFQTPQLTLLQFSESVRRDLSPVATGNAKCLDWYAVLAGVTCDARRVTIAVEFCQLLCGDVAMLDNVVNERFWPLCGDLSSAREKLFWYFLHSETVIQESEAAGAPLPSDFLAQFGCAQGALAKGRAIRP